MKLSSLVLGCQEHRRFRKPEWIEVKALQNAAGLYSAQRKYGLGPGEMSSILLAKELGANPVLLDDYRARKLASQMHRGHVSSTKCVFKAAPCVLSPASLRPMR